LLVNGSLDYCPLRQMTRDFAASLKDKDCEVQVKKIPWRTHETVLFDILQRTADTATCEAIAKFIEAHLH
jgi:hypothetical protein